MLRYQRRKASRAAADSASVTSWRLLDALGSRLVQVAPDCTNQQLTRALWAYGVSRRAHAEVIGVACRQLPRRLPSMTVPELATAAWSLAAATSLAPKPVQEPVREALQAVARHLVATRPANLSAPAVPPVPAPAAAAAPGALTPAADVVAAAVAAGQAALAADKPWMDHRSALKLAWAFSVLDVRDAQALDVIADASAARINSQLQAHNFSSGPLAPRATYLYRTIRGRQAWPRPRPPRARTGGRPSRYLWDERPRMVLRDFTPSSLAPLLAAFRRLGHRHEGLLQASAQHVVASAGPTLRVAPSELTRLTGAMEALHFRHAPALAALLSASRLSELPAPSLARLTVLAAEWRVPATRRRDGGLYGRLARQLVARAWITEESDGAGGAARELLSVDGGAAPAAEASQAGAGGGGVEDGPQLDPRAREGWDRRLPSLSWRTDAASLQREEEQWRGVNRRPEDGCPPGELARAVLALAKAGYTDPDLEESPLVVALFARLWPFLTALKADALADLALAAVQYDTQLNAQRAFDIPPALNIIRDATHVLLYGAAALHGGDADKKGLRRRLLSMAGYGTSDWPDAESRTAATAAQAEQLRREMGLSAGGGFRLALALTLRPEAVAEEELRAALSLLDLERTDRRELGELIRRMRQSGRNWALPQRLLTAVGEAAAP